ncbi:MAG: Ig-like domain-containing protein, partial [Pseudorhodobacter sp.]
APTAAEARALAEWYLALAQRRFLIGDSDFAAAPGSAVFGSGPFGNGDFSIADPGAEGFAWHIGGTAGMVDGVMRLSEGVPLDGFLQQDFAIPDGAGDLIVQLRPNLVAGVASGPGDAFEIALRRQSQGGETAVSPIGLAGGDAAFNIQTDGTVHLGAGVTVAGLGPDGRVIAGEVLTVTISLAGVEPGDRARLYLDLLGTGGLGSTVDILSVTMERVENRAPVAVDDAAEVVAGGSVSVPVLDNDSDADGDALAVAIVTGPANGIAEVLADGRILYIPATGFVGADSLTYRISDGRGGSAEAVLALTVMAAPTPVGIADPGVLAVAEGGRIDVALLAKGDGAEGATFRLVGDVAGAGLSADGLLSVTGLDGPATLVLSVEIRTPDGQTATRAITVEVSNVAPTGTLTLPGILSAGLPVTVGFAATDPGEDTISGWRIDWGDGTVDMLPGDATTASHVYAGPGARVITLMATDEDGEHPIAAESIVVAPETLKITDLRARTGGIEISFNRPILAEVIDLYGPGSPLPDITVTRVADGAAVRGSLVFMPGGLIFLPTVAMEAGQYDIRVRSGDDALTGTTGNLDGNGDGIAGDDFTQRVTLPAISALVRLDDAIAPAGAAFRDRDGMAGLGITLSSDGGLREVVFVVDFDPAMVVVSGFVPGSSLPLTESRVERDETGPRHRLTVTLRLTGPLPAELVELGRLSGNSVDDVIYGADGWIGVTVTAINGAAVSDSSFNALHMAVLPGDLTGDGRVDADDVAARAAVLAGIDSGFAAYPRIDPDRLVAAIPTGEESPDPDPGPARPVSSGGGGVGFGFGGGLFGLLAGLFDAMSDGDRAGVVAPSGRIGAAKIDLGRCTFTEGDLPEDLRKRLAAMAGVNGGRWCAMTEAEFARQTGDQLLPEGPEASGDAPGDEAPSYPYWCGAGVPAEVSDALDALFVARGLGAAPGAWCVIRPVDERAAMSRADFDPATLPGGVELVWDTMPETPQKGEAFALFAAATMVHARPGAASPQQRRPGTRHVWGSDELIER